MFGQCSAELMMIRFVIRSLDWNENGRIGRLIMTRAQPPFVGLPHGTHSPDMETAGLRNRGRRTILAMPLDRRLYPRLLGETVQLGRYAHSRWANPRNVTGSRLDWHPIKLPRPTMVFWAHRIATAECCAQPISR